MRRLPDIESTLHGDFSDVADQWRSGSSGWLPEDAEQRKWLLAPHQWKWPLMHILPKIKTQRQMAGQMTSSVWHLLTQKNRRCQSDARIKYADCGGENCTRLVRGRGGCVRGRGRDHPHEVAGLDEGYPILASFKRLFLLQGGEGRHQVQKQLARSKLHDGSGM